MRILITGGSGFVASHLVDLCLENGDEVAITVRWNEDLSRMEHYKDKVKIYYCELTDLSSLIRAINDFRPNVISHLAAQSFVPYSFDNPIQTMNTNAIGTLNILEAVRLIQEVMGLSDNWGKYDPLIHICSSSEFYGKVPKEKQPIDESFPASPMNPYGVGKVAADLMSQLYEKYYDMRILITRMFTHTGPGRTMMSAECRYARQIAELESQRKKEERDGSDVVLLETRTSTGEDKKREQRPDRRENHVDIVYTGNMKSIRTWRDVRDAVKDYYQLFKNNNTGIYNISGNTQKSIQEVLDYLLSISKLDKSKIKFETDESLLRKVDVDVQTADISKFKNEIGQSTKYTFEETMRDLLDFWRKNV